MTLDSSGLTSYHRPRATVQRSTAMPFIIRKQGNRYCVYTKGADGEPRGDTHGCHATEAEAQAQMRALYVHVPEARKDEEDGALVAYGGAVKALGGGRVAGYLVSYGGPADADGDGEWFTPETDYGIDFPSSVGVYYHHGFSRRLGTRRLTAGKVDRDERGIRIEAALDLSDSEQARIYREAEGGRLGWSSGAPSHLTDPPRHRAGGAIKQWLLAEASLTPTPSDRRNRVLALKSWAEELPSESVEESLTAAEHAAQVVSVNDEYAERLESRLEARVKAGRVLSAANRQELESVLESLEPVLSRIRAVIARAAPAPGESLTEVTIEKTPESSVSAVPEPAPELLTPAAYDQLLQDTLSQVGWMET